MTFISLAGTVGIHSAIASNLKRDFASLAMTHFAGPLPTIAVERYGGYTAGSLFHIKHASINPIDCIVGHLTVPDGPGLGAGLAMHKQHHSAYKPF